MADGAERPPRPGVPRRGRPAPRSTPRQGLGQLSDDATPRLSPALSQGPGTQLLCATGVTTLSSDVVFSFLCPSPVSPPPSVALLSPRTPVSPCPAAVPPSFAPPAPPAAVAVPRVAERHGLGAPKHTHPAPPVATAAWHSQPPPPPASPASPPTILASSPRMPPTPSLPHPCLQTSPAR